MNNLVFLSLMFIPFHTKALSYSEQTCAAQNIYHEAREDKASWYKVLQVANNRKKNPKKYNAKSSHLCDIVHSSQYTTARFKRIKESKVYKEITLFVKHYKQPLQSNLVYFSGHHKLHFRSKF